MIYLIADTQKQWCKIGYSINPTDRIKNIQCGMPFTLEIVHVIEGEREDERKLHKKFKKQHIRGEWFKYHKDITDYISQQPQLAVDTIRESGRRIVVQVTEEHKTALFNYLLGNSDSNKETLVSRKIMEIAGAKIGISTNQVNDIVKELWQNNKIYGLYGSIYCICPFHEWQKLKGNKLEDMKMNKDRK